MEQFFLDEDGNVERGIKTALPVQEVDPQLIRFYYGDCERIAQVVTLKSGSALRPLLLAIELWNSRDGIHPEGMTKTFHCDSLYNVENV